MQVMHMDRLFYGFKTEIIRAAIDHPPFDATTGHPHGEAIGIVVTAVLHLDSSTILHNRRAAEFRPANHNGFIQEPA